MRTDAERWVQAEHIAAGGRPRTGGWATRHPVPLVVGNVLLVLDWPRKSSNPRSSVRSARTAGGPGCKAAGSRRVPTDPKLRSGATVVVRYRLEITRRMRTVALRVLMLPVTVLLVVALVVSSGDLAIGSGRLLVVAAVFAALPLLPARRLAKLERAA